MSCVSQCYDSSIGDDTLNYYNYDGFDKVCYQDCPNGTYGDPSTGSCMTQCSVVTGNAGYFALG